MNIDNKELLRLAVNAAENSYSPYSEFRVGAALMTSCGRVFIGCNIENASFSLTNCAERTAIFNAVSSGYTDFVAIAIAGSGDGDFTSACVPCGACLQVMTEFCSPDFKIILADGTYALSDFLPRQFNKDSL